MDAVKIQPDPRDARIAELEVRNAQLEARIAKLEALLAAATRSSKRQAAVVSVKLRTFAESLSAGSCRG